MMMLALVTLGLFSYNRLAIEQWPDIEFPFILSRSSIPEPRRRPSSAT